MKKIKLPVTAPTTTPGYVSGNRQMVVADTGFPSTTRSGQRIYRLRCLDCGFEYGSNGIDNEKRLCPKHQGGVSGEPLREPSPGLFDGLGG